VTEVKATGDKVTADKVTGDKVSGEKVTGDKVTGDKVKGHHVYRLHAFDFQGNSKTVASIIVALIPPAACVLAIYSQTSHMGLNRFRTAQQLSQRGLEAK
jgi:hypothetical protein